MKREFNLLLIIIVLLIIQFYTRAFADSNFPSERLVFSTANGIFVLEESSLEAKKISSDYSISNLIEYNGYIFFSTQNTVFKRIDLNGNNTKIYSEMKHYPDIYNKLFFNDHLFFPLMSSSSVNYYYLNIINGNLIKLFDGIVEETLIDNNVLYIVGLKDYSEKVLYKLDLNNLNNNIEKDEYFFCGKYLFFDGEWFYFDSRRSEFVLQTKYLNLNSIPRPFICRINKNTLYKEKIPFSEKLKSSIYCFSKHNNNIYFLSGDIFNFTSGYLYKLNIENFNIEKVLDKENIIKYKIYQENIYYIYFLNNDYYLGKYNIKEKNNMILTKLKISFPKESELVFADNYVFFVSDSSLCRLTLDGSNSITIFDEKPELYFIINDSIYYQTKSGFYKSNFDGTDLLLITSDKIKDYIIIKLN